MATLINRIQRAMLGSAGPEKVRALLIEMAIPAGGSGANALREARRGFLRPISHEAILRDALESLGLTGGGTGARPLNRIRSALLHNLVDSETTLRDGLNDLLGSDDLAGGADMPPTDIALSAATVAEDAELGHVIGMLSATDADTDDVITFSLVDDAGGLFGIDGTNLIVTGVLDYETAEEEGGSEYSAPAVHFDGTVSFRSIDPLVATDSAQGFFSVWVKPIDVDAITFFSNDQFIISGNVHAELADADYDNYVYFDSTTEAITNDEWNHVLIAWDTNFASGSRRVAVYVDDAPVTLEVGDDEGIAFDVGYAFEMTALSKQGFTTEGDFSDSGLWIGSTIVEGDGTITEVNRRKFISASGKPIDPTNWPASPVLKFVGNAASFAVNGGSGGAFALMGGSLTNASTSPSD